jgi:hypothetical protein
MFHSYASERTMLGQNARQNLDTIFELLLNYRSEKGPVFNNVAVRTFKCIPDQDLNFSMYSGSRSDPKTMQSRKIFKSYTILLQKGFLRKYAGYKQ